MIGPCSETWRPPTTSTDLRCIRWSRVALSRTARRGTCMVRGSLSCRRAKPSCFNLKRAFSTEKVPAVLSGSLTPSPHTADISADVAEQNARPQEHANARTCASADGTPHRQRFLRMKKRAEARKYLESQLQFLDDQQKEMTTSWYRLSRLGPTRALHCVQKVYTNPLADCADAGKDASSSRTGSKERLELQPASVAAINGISGRSSQHTQPLNMGDVKANTAMDSIDIVDRHMLIPMDDAEQELEFDESEFMTFVVVSPMRVLEE
eukprot:scaffold650_cov407-Prasinococcus_capsulatus_cf.AAC.3